MLYKDYGREPGWKVKEDNSIIRGQRKHAEKRNQSTMAAVNVTNRKNSFGH